MTDLQYRRWKNLSLRVAHRGLGLRLRASRRKVADCVKDFFRMFEWDEVAYDPTLIERTDSWDHTSRKSEDGRWGPYVCDLVDERLAEHWNPYNYHCNRQAHDRWDDLWGTRIRSCLRVGLDMASESSAGVIGFTAGDIRRMYRGNVPTWLFGDDPLTVQHFDGVAVGVGLILGKTEPGEVFADLPDNAGVWL